MMKRKVKTTKAPYHAKGSSSKMRGVRMENAGNRMKEKKVGRRGY